MSDKQHTPTPYRVSERTADDTVDWANILGPNNTFIAMCGSRNAVDSPGRANADFIVQACNLHDELVEALKALLDTAVVVDAGNKARDIKACGFAAELFAQARAVLAQCEKGD